MGRQNWLSNRGLETLADILVAGCAAWDERIAQPGTIRNIEVQKWAHIGWLLTHVIILQHERGKRSGVNLSIENAHASLHTSASFRCKTGVRRCVF